MKKTTYILIAFLAGLLILAFVTPLIFLTDNNLSDEELEKHSATLSAGKDSSRVEVAPFKSISPITENISSHISVQYEAPTYITVIESDSVKAPTVYLDSYWNGNISVDVEDTSLYLYIDMKVLRKGSQGKVTYITVPPEAARMAVVEVPRGSLQYIETGLFGLELEGFKDADMYVQSSSGLSVEDCSFSHLTYSTVAGDVLY